MYFIYAGIALIAYGLFDVNKKKFVKPAEKPVAPVQAAPINVVAIPESKKDDAPGA